MVINVTVRQVYWISLEVISFGLIMLIGWLAGLHVENRIEWIATIFVSVLIATSAGYTIASLGYTAKYIIILNSSVYFLVWFGILLLLISSVLAEILNETSSLTVGGTISAIISFLMARRNGRKKNKQIEQVVIEHIDDV